MFDPLDVTVFTQLWETLPSIGKGLLQAVGIALAVGLAVDVMLRVRR